MGTASSPTPAVDPSQTYRQGLLTNIKYAPVVADAEQRMRSEYDAPSVQDNLARQQQQGGNFLDLYRSGLAQSDPGNEALQKQLGGAISSDLAKGYNLSAGQTRQVQQATRAEQVTTGNIYGNAAVSQEASAIGKASFSAYQQRLQNAGNFLSHDNALQLDAATQKLLTGATLPDRSASYVSGAAGTDAQSIANATYQEDLQFIQTYNPDDYLGPWQRAAQGAYIGLREGWQGGSYGGFVIGAFGAVGGALGGSFQGFINAPDYQFNVQNSGYAIYGNPNAASSAATFGAGVGVSAGSAWLQAASTAASSGG